MISVVPLRFGTAFKKAFCDPEDFSAFASDVLGIPVKVDSVSQEFSFPQPIGKVKVEYDLFAEDNEHRLIVEIQHVRESDFFDRFLHYHLIALVEQAEGHAQYRIQRDVYTLVVLTTPPRDKELRFSVATMTMDPTSEKGEPLGVYRHRLVFLNPRVINEATPPAVRRWFEFIADSLDGQMDESQYTTDAQRRIMAKIKTDTTTPEELAHIKDEAAWEETKREARLEGRQEGRQEGLAPLVRQFERRLARALSEDDRATLRERLLTLGAERLGDAVLDQTPAELAAWLADPNAR